MGTLSKALMPRNAEVMRRLPHDLADTSSLEVPGTVDAVREAS